MQTNSPARLRIYYVFDICWPTCTIMYAFFNKALGNLETIDFIFSVLWEDC